MQVVEFASMEKMANAVRILGSPLQMSLKTIGFAQIQIILKNCVKNAAKLIFIVPIEDYCS